jgi:hypothetical protein
MKKDGSSVNDAYSQSPSILRFCSGNRCCGARGSSRFLRQEDSYECRRRTHEQ